MKIGFVIISHNNPPQLRRLVGCLQRIYDDPPIAVHHDFSQCTLCRSDFPSDTFFVTPHIRTSWGRLSLVLALLRALELLYRKTTPDWFVVLSGADYPTMPANQVSEELKSSEVDALLDYRKTPTLSDGTARMLCGIRISKDAVQLGDLEIASSSISENPALQFFNLPDQAKLAWRRYLCFNLWLPVIIRHWRRIGRFSLHLPFEDPRTPFTRQFRCFYGDLWFAGNQKVAEILLNPTNEHLRLRHYLRWRGIPDECYFQTVLANAPGLKISTATRRFADWSQGADRPHPKFLELHDLSAIVSSRAHFARKFVPESPVLNEIDKILS